MLNDISDCIDRKKLNRLAKQKILVSIAESVSDCQNRNESPENLLGTDINAYCDKMCENAPKARFIEKLLAFLRNATAISLFLSVIVLAVCVYKRSSLLIEGVTALQLVGGVLVSALCFPLICYRDAMRMPGNLVIPRNPVSHSNIISMVAYSLLCIVCTVAYALIFWIFPTVPILNGFSFFKLDVMAWVVISAAAFAVFYFLERYAVKRSFSLNY
jgi:hypothetical protein